ncbi:MAG: EAL domain-containing protein [Pseudomonadota bacterium]
MTRNLQPSLLLLLVLIFAAVQTVTVLVVLDSSRHSADTAMQASLRNGERVLKQVLADELRTLADGARKAATDRQLATNAAGAALRANDPGPVYGGFSALVDAAGTVHFAGAGAPEALSGDRLASVLQRASAQGQSAFLTATGGDALLLAAQPVATSGNPRSFVIGKRVDDSLLQRVATLSGLDVVLAGEGAGATARVAATFRNGLSDGQGAGGDFVSRQVRLDTAGATALRADLQLPLSVGLRPHRELRLKLIVTSVATVLCAALTMTVLAGLWLAGRFTEPLQDISAAIARIEGGTYTKPVDVRRRDQVGRLARAVNDMQKEIAEREGRIVHHAQYDALTGLTNRSVVSDKLKLAVSRAQRSGASVAAMAVDLSRFNEINDTMGHEVGDLVLKEVARRLASNTRVSDTVARVGGDEFFVIIEEVDEKLANHMAEFLASALEAPIVVEGSNVHLRAHIGMAMYPQHCETPDALRRLASVALGAAKEQASATLVYEPGQDEKHLRELAITHDLPSALENDQFYLQFQPKIDIQTQQVECVEALIRWKHPQLGLVPPDEFISVLERSGRISALTDWVLESVVKQVRRWHSHGYPLGVAVNLSVRDLMDESLPDRVVTLLRHYVLEPDYLSVEVTESAVMQDPERAIGVLNRLKEAGIKIALDDFGTGQTSLALLKQLPVDELKIDKSFVQDIRTDTGDSIIVKSTIDLGHNMGFIVVAEGVENNYGWNLLKSYGCDLIQGYLVSRPLSASDMEEWYLRLQARHVNKLDLSALAHI